MKVLWITNIVFPEAEQMLKGYGELKASGGWMLGAADSLTRQPGIILAVATVSPLVKKLTLLKGERITYYLLPYGKGNERINHEYEPYWREVYDAFLPDVVHIHGTEYSHGLAYIESCGAEHVCVSIQGLVSGYYPYYYDGLSRKEIRCAITPASILRGGIIKGYKSFKHSGEYEKELIRRVNHIIGRTSWDREKTWAVNPNAMYHFGGETLRPVFYENTIWNYETCRPHSIFLSQAYYPIKGLHMLLKAMPLVLRHYPDATIRIAGSNIARTNGGIIDTLKISNYGMIIRKLINKYKLEKTITFTGALDGDGMRKEYLNSNVFICPSSIENSPNSIGEAQVLGVPVIASYVGGVCDMMRGGEHWLYRFEEIEMLAYKICEVFKMGGSIDTEPMRQVALQRHDPVKNMLDLMNIYSAVSNQ